VPLFTQVYNWVLVNLTLGSKPTMDVFHSGGSTRLWGITTEFVGFILQSLELRSIVLG